MPKYREKPIKRENEARNANKGTIEERQNEDTAYKVERYDPTLLESSVSERRSSAISISTKPINRDSSAKERRDIAGQDLLQTKVPGRL